MPIYKPIPGYRPMVRQDRSAPLPAVTTSASVTKDVQFLVKSFRRFASLRRLVESIRRHYPAARILIADDSFEQVPDPLPADADAVRRMPGVTWRQLPFDTGLGAGRNLLVEESTAPFLVNCDDDFVFTDETRIENLIQVLQDDPAIDLVGGLVRQTGGVAQNWCGHFRFSGERPHRQINVDPLHSEWRSASGIWYRSTDLAFNFFAARRESLQRFPWDRQFKIIGEHLDHFLTLHAGDGRVVYTPSAIVTHLPEQPADYVPFRRRPEFVEMLRRKWGLAGMPNHPALLEPNVPVRNPRNLLACETSGRPNVILFGVGHSGTSIATRILHALGWQAGDADAEYAESIAIRAINERALRGRFDPDAARRALVSLPQPWALKDPRFIHTIDRWLPLLREYEPTLIWLVRDPEAVVASYRRRGERVRFGMSVVDAAELARGTFARWPWGKVRVDYERVAEAVGLFDTAYR